MEQRKEIERRQYDNQAARMQERAPGKSGAQSVAVELRAPYIAFEQAARAHAPADGIVVDLGAGQGLFSLVARGPGRMLVATDISHAALQVARRLAATEATPLFLVCADAERLPFRDGSVGLVTSAGALYCFDLPALKDEVRRVLRDDGAFVLVDSLDDSPVYRFNRFVGYLRGTRTALATRNVPTLGAIESLGSHFRRVEIDCYGVLSFLLPLFRPLLGAERAGALVDGADRYLRWMRAWSFKAVVVARGTTV